MTTQPPVDLHELIRAIRGSNPFISNRVTQADAEGVDVSSIHEKEFQRLKRQVLSVRDTGATAGVLLLGAAGVGKSHLLARLFRWAHEERCATVVYLHNVLASPERLPRYLLNATMSSLAGRGASAYAESQLYALLNRAISAGLEKGKKHVPSATHRASLLRQIGAQVDPEGLVMPVFIAFLEQAIAASHGDPEAEARASAAAQWLSGETIEPDLASAIGLRSDDGEGAQIADDVAVQRTLDVVCRLCGRAGRPFVLCVDQVDNLDTERVSALSSFLHAALDNGHDLVVVTSGVKESMLKFEREGVIAQAAWDRLAQYKVELAKITAPEARQIVEGRVARFMQPFRAVPEVHRLAATEPLLPLATEWLDQRLAKVIEARPRDVISWARERWEEEQDRVEELTPEGWVVALEQQHRHPDRHVIRPTRFLNDSIDETVAKKLKEATLERTLNPERLPPDADNLATLATTLLRTCVGNSIYTLRSVERFRGRTPATYDIHAVENAPNGSKVTSGVFFVTSDNATKSAFALRRVVEDPNPPHHQILVTDEERRPLKLGAKGREYFEELRAKGRFEHIRLCFEDYARLDALTVVLGSARVGDLEVEHPQGQIRAVSEAECLESLHRQHCFLESPLLRELLTEGVTISSSAPPPLRPTVEVIRQRIAAELHWRLGMTGREMGELLIAREGLDFSERESLWLRVLDVARAMHQEGHLFAAAQDDDLFLQYRHKEAE